MHPPFLFYSDITTFYISIVCSDFAIVKYFEMPVEDVYKRQAEEAVKDGEGWLNLDELKALVGE